MDQMTQLPLIALRESPFNPRKTFGEAALAELAKSIGEQGLLQPVVVRPIADTLDDPHAVPRYEIVFGHRRSRAAALAGLEQVTCIVRDMTDQQAAIAQVHENLQRADVSVLEEAESFLQLRAAHGMSADAIAEAVAKSRSYVYGRLKLMAAADEVLTAVREQALPADVALELARLPVHAAQRAALKLLRHGQPEGTWPSVRQCARQIRSMFELRITQAPWPADDATLVPPAGACITCPHLLHNDPAMEGMEADLCLHATCYDTKKAAYIDHQAFALRTEGHQVITGDEAAAIFQYGAHYLSGDWIRATAFNLDDELPLEQALQTLRKAGRPAPKPVFAIVPQTGHVVQMYRASETDAAHADWAELMRKLRIEEGEDGEDGEPAESATPVRGRADNTADWLTAERAFLDYEAVQVIRLRVLQQAKARQRTTDELRMLIMREYMMGSELSGDVAEAYGVGNTAMQAYSDDKAACAYLDDKLAQMSADDLAYLLLGLALHDQVCHVTPYSGRHTAARAAALAQHYGVDAAEIAAQVAQQHDQRAQADQQTTQEAAHV